MPCPSSSTHAHTHQASVFVRRLGQIIDNKEQKRCLSSRKSSLYEPKDTSQDNVKLSQIIYPCVSYKDALSATNLSDLFFANLSCLADRRSAISAKLFADIVSNQDHKLRHLLPQPNTCAEHPRGVLNFRLPVYKMNRMKNCFIYSHCIRS